MPIMVCRKNADSLSVKFGSDTSIYNAAKIKKGLSKILSQPVKNFNLDLSEITDTDVSFIQLLISFNERLKHENRRVRILNLPANSEFMYTASSCGIDIQGLFELEEQSI
jgi:anti-anti-sigma regulatory factor